MNVWIQFIFSAVIIVIAGARLTVYADLLGDRFNIHKAWLGVVLLGLVTSLPEAITSLTSVISLNSIDLALGNILGSNVMNPMLFVILDFIYRKNSVTNDIPDDRSHTLSAIFSIFLSTIVLAEIYLNTKIHVFGFGYISPGLVLIAVIYFVGMRVLAQRGHGVHIQVGPQKSIIGQEVSLKIIQLNISVSALCVVLAAFWLAQSSDILAQSTGLGRTFFGSIFLALVTSLPEIVVTVSALRIGSLNLAVGNIFGSNMINVFIIVLCGICYPQGQILAQVTGNHMLTIILSIILVSVVIIGLNFQNKKTLFSVGWDSIVMIIFFITGTSLLYYLR